MNTKTRIQKLESVKRDTVETHYRQFVHEVRRGGDLFFIGALKVDKATYTKGLAEYMCVRDTRVPAEIIVNCTYADGVQ